MSVSGQTNWLFLCGASQTLTVQSRLCPINCADFSVGVFNSWVIIWYKIWLKRRIHISFKRRLQLTTGVSLRTFFGQDKRRHVWKHLSTPFSSRQLKHRHKQESLRLRLEITEILNHKSQLEWALTAISHLNELNGQCAFSNTAAAHDYQLESLLFRGHDFPLKYNRTGENHFGCNPERRNTVKLLNVDKTSWHT